MKTEAKRGMTILATIHQPSSEIFYSFDRVILLADGYTIFNGPSADAKAFLENLGMQLNKYTNPSDQLLKLANAPHLIQPGLTIPALAAKLEPRAPLLLQSDLTNFSQVAKSRKSSSFCRQFYHLWVRTMTWAYRNPMALRALLGIALFNTMIVSSVFHNVGAARLVIDPADPTKDLTKNQ
jgi:hypothetical protein